MTRKGIITMMGRSCHLRGTVTPVTAMQQRKSVPIVFQSAHVCIEDPNMNMERQSMKHTMEMDSASLLFVIKMELFQES